MPAAEKHRAVQHRCVRRGVEAMSVTSDRPFPRHAHDQYGIGLLCFGAHRTWSGVGLIEAQAGDVITVNPGEIHDGHPVDGRARSWRMLYFDAGLVAEEVGCDLGGGLEITRPAVRDAEVAARLQHLFVGVTAVRPDVLAVEEDLLRTLMLVFRRHAGRGALATGSTPAVTKALRRLDEAPERQVSLAELAALSGVSRFQLLRGFAREVGTTPHAWLVQRRVQTARRLLASGRTPAATAAEAGFADQSHMTRAFVRQFGVTPARYRAAVG